MLLGLHTLTDSAEFIVLVEGLYDYARQLQYGYPVVSSMHANLTVYQAAILISLGLPVVVFYDNDLAGRDGTKIAVNRLIDHVPVRRVLYPKNAAPGLDPGKVTRQQADKLIGKAQLCCLKTTI